MSNFSLRKAVTAASVFLLVLPAYAFGQDLGEKTPLNLPTSDPKALTTAGSSGGSLVRTFVGLAIVIAVIYGVAWVLKQMKSSREERGRGRGLSSAAVIPLGPGRSLHLVRAGRELVLVGVAEGGVTPIRTYSEEEARTLGLDVLDDEDDGPAPGPGRKLPTLRTFVDALRDRTTR
jgi:flagellar protein FliO/FliZ